MATTDALVFLDSFHITQEILVRDHINTVIELARAGGAVMIAAAFVLLRCTTTGSCGGSIYGP